MITIKRTNSDNLDFQTLVRELDKELTIRDGDEHDYYAQFNKIDAIKHVVVAYENDEAVGCGAIKSFDENSMEVKRMFVPETQRSKGIATLVLRELERWASELGFAKCVLETGYKQPEAIRLYEKNGYSQIPNYGQYVGMDNSICFEKKLFENLMKKNFKEISDKVDKEYDNFILETVNSHALRIAVMQGEYKWHYHENSDELFIVLEGELKIEIKDQKTVFLKSGDFMKIPAQTIHKTSAVGRTVNLCFERDADDTIFLE